jgi:hypothetical protein
MMRTMPFGQYKNTLLRELPDPYLLWVLTLPDLRDPLLEAVEHEVDRRMGKLAQEGAQ